MYQIFRCMYTKKRGERNSFSSLTVLISSFDAGQGGNKNADT